MVYVISYFEWLRLGFSVVIGLVFLVGLKNIPCIVLVLLINLVEESGQIRFLFVCLHGNPKFNVQRVVWYSATKDLSRGTFQCCVICRVVCHDSNVDISVPLR